VTDVVCSGRARVSLKPLLNDLPLVGAVQVQSASTTSYFNPDPTLVPKLTLIKLFPLRTLTLDAFSEHAADYCRLIHDTLTLAC